MGSISHCMQWHLSLVILFLLLAFSDAYDPMDPNGNITIKWDFQTIDGTSAVRVTIYNNQLYRHIELPGWHLSWTWPNDEVIFSMQGAEATEQGNCSRFKGAAVLPHSCEKSPVIVDLPIGTPYNMQTSNCCRNGILTSLVQDPTKYAASFQMFFGGGNGSGNKTLEKPSNFSIGVHGYTCSEMEETQATRYKVDQRRTTQALMTWQVTCSYSQFRESSVQSCCVSLSTFYNETIVPCPRCSCGCQPSSTQSKCLRESEKSDLLELPNGDGDNSDSGSLVRCTQHMCPIRIHWHVKLNYKEYWRVKVTITNFNVLDNYTDWNLVMQHPNLQDLTEVFSFNYQPLVQYGDINDTGMFWGIKYYNEMLLQDGNVQTEILLKKNPKDFTFRGGWGFPRRISFNGHDCVMPSPDSYPSLPNLSPKLLDVSLIALNFQLFVVLFASLCIIV